MNKISQNDQMDTKEMAQDQEMETVTPQTGFKVRTGIKAGWGLVVGGLTKGTLPQGE
jgi:hypothetical protein